MFFLTLKKVLFLLACIFFVGYFLDSSTLLPFKGYRGAFVVPLIKKNKTYILVGCEAGGKDKGTYCIPGGSSGWWFLRDTNPLETASREFCEETLTDLNYNTVRNLIEGSKQALFVDVFHAKKIVTYVVPFEEGVINDIVKNFLPRRNATYFWQYYYREMDSFALVELTNLIGACTVHTHDKIVRVKGLLYDASSLEYKEADIAVRPILRAIVNTHAQELKKLG